MNAIDFAAVGVRLLSQSRSLLPEWYPEGKLTGHEFKVGDLGGSPGESLSINVDTGRWSDFATGESGSDLVSLYAAKHGIKQSEAVKRLGNGHDHDPPQKQAGPAKQENIEWTPIIPVPEGTAQPTDDYYRKIGGEWTKLKFIRRWTYTNDQGQVCGHVCRFEMFDAEGVMHKDIVPQVWCSGSDGTFAWRWRSMPPLRPLYNLAALLVRPDDPVVVVEGEKCAEAAAQLMPHYVAVAWAGGAAAWRKTDWKPLKGRQVLCWPDADKQVAENESAAKRYGVAVGERIPMMDQPGMKAMWGIGQHLAGLGAAEVKFITPDDDTLPDGWDVADAVAQGWDWQRFKEWAVPRVREVSAPIQQRRQATPPPERSADSIIMDDLPFADDAARGEPPPASIYQDAPRDEEARDEGAWPAALDLEALALREPERPQFIISDWLPTGYAALLAGHGGAGKSELALRLGVCAALGVPYFGMPVERHCVLYLSCEDREPVLHWRLARICRHLGVDMAGLREWLQIVDLVGRDTILWDRDPRTGNTITPAYAQLGERVGEYGTELLIVDGISDTFGGNENARGEVKRYVNALVGLIPAARGAVLLVGHVNRPTAAGSGSTEGYSGSTGWHNAVRARLYLYPETVTGEDGGRPERTGELILELQKSNLGRTDQRIKLAWDDDAHLFLACGPAAETGLMRSLRETAERNAILEALRACARACPPIIVPAAMTGPRSAYRVLSLRPEFPESLRAGKPGVHRFWKKIEELRQMGAIREDSYRRSNRHVIAQLVATTEGVR